MKKGSSKKLAITPLGDRVLVAPFSEDDRSKKSPAGIIIPDTVSKEKPEQGKIVAVGKGKRAKSGEIIPVGVSVGDTVLFSKYGYDEVTVDGVEYYIIKEENILAVIK
jgi:chaperonin GroES